MIKKTLLATGVLGFIGSNFVRRFYSTDLCNRYRLVGVDKGVEKENLLNKFEHPDYNFYLADICDQHIINNIFEIEKPDYVIHAAAESHVCASISNPNIFIKSNILGSQVLINSALKYKIEKFVQVSCYDEQTRALTRSGAKYYYELNVGDLVLSVNPESGNLEEKKIEKIIVQEYSGQMYHFKDPRVDLLTTPNHRFIYSDSAKCDGKLNWTTAEKLDGLISPHLIMSTIKKDFVKTINIPNIGEVDALALFYVCGVFIGDGFTAYQEKKVKNKSGYSFKERAQKCRDPKTGRMMKNKVIGNQEYSICKSYRIWFDVPENDKARKYLEQSLTKLNIKFTGQKNKSGEHVYFSSKEWLEFFDTFGKYAKNKHIPEWMFDHGTELLTYLWRGIHDSDGHGLGLRQPQLSTTSIKLSQQSAYLAEMIGMHSKITERHTKGIVENRIIEGDSLMIHFGEMNQPKIPKSKIINYTGIVWCLKVEDNKNFLVERNGRTAFCGNTDEVFGQHTSKFSAPWTEESCPKPRNAYAASKYSAELLVHSAHEIHGLKYNITRASNNFGPRQVSRNLLPKIIINALINKKIPLHGENGSQCREWLFVNDHIDGIITVLEHGTPNEIYNIGGDNELSNLELTKLILKKLDKSTDLIEFVPDRLGGSDWRYSISTAKIRNIGWNPTVDFETRLDYSIEWYKNNYQKYL